MAFRVDYGRKRGNTKAEKERERLKHKYKKEFKGALREIRKDTRFLAHTKLSDSLRRLVHYRVHYIVHITRCTLYDTHTHAHNPNETNTIMIDKLNKECK